MMPRFDVCLFSQRLSIRVYVLESLYLPHRSSHDLVGTIDFPLGLARQAVDAFALIEAAVAHAALQVLALDLGNAVAPPPPSQHFAGADESKSAEAIGLSSGDYSIGDSNTRKSSTATSPDGSLAVTAALTVHTEGLWVWLSVKNYQGESFSAKSHSSTGSTELRNALTMAETTAALLNAAAVLTGSMAEAVDVGVRNVPLKRSLSRLVHFEVIHTDLPRKHSQPTQTALSKRNDYVDNSLYEGFPGDGLGDSNSQPPSTTNATHLSTSSLSSVDFEHLLQRRHARLTFAKAELLSLKARTVASIAAEGVQPRVAMEAEQRMEGVQEDLKTLVKLLLLNREAEEVLNNEHGSFIDTFQTCLWSSA